MEGFLLLKLISTGHNRTPTSLILLVWYCDNSTGQPSPVVLVKTGISRHVLTVARLAICVCASPLPNSIATIPHLRRLQIGARSHQPRLEMDEAPSSGSIWTERFLQLLPAERSLVHGDSQQACWEQMGEGLPWRGWKPEKEGKEMAGSGDLDQYVPHVAQSH